MLSRVALSLRPALPRLTNSARTFIWNRDPFSDMRNMIREMEHHASQMERQMERFLGNNSLGGRLPSLLPGFSRRVPVIQSGKQQQGEDNFHLALDLREFKPENIKVTLKNRTLSIEAREEQTQEGYFSARETNHQYTIPDDVDINNLVSTLEPNGYLSIEAPRAKVEPKQIPIQKEQGEGQTLLKDETSKQAAA